jgi:hypothetical protein
MEKSDLLTGLYGINRKATAYVKSLQAENRLDTVTNAEVMARCQSDIAVVCSEDMVLAAALLDEQTRLKMEKVFLNTVMLNQRQGVGNV